MPNQMGLMGQMLQLGSGGLNAGAVNDNRAYAQAAQQSGRDYQLGQQKLANDRAAINAQLAPLNSRNQHFNQLLPMIQGALSSGLVGGQSGPGPQISAAPIWDEGQIQSQVNTQRAQNDAATQSQMRQTQSQMAGRGFSSNSPLLAALQSGQQMANMQANSAADQGIRWNAAQGNAEQVLKGQMAQEQQYSNRMNEDIERRKANNQYVSSLLGVLAGLA